MAAMVKKLRSIRRTAHLDFGQCIMRGLGLKSYVSIFIQALFGSWISGGFLVDFPRIFGSGVLKILLKILQSVR